MGTGRTYPTTWNHIFKIIDNIAVPRGHNIFLALFIHQPGARKGSKHIFEGKRLIQARHVGHTKARKTNVLKRVFS